MPERAARSARKPVVDSPSSASSAGDDEDGSEEEESSEEEGLPLAENMTPSTRRPRKVPRQSADKDVSAVCQALQENRISYEVPRHCRRAAALAAQHMGGQTNTHCPLCSDSTNLTDPHHWRMCTLPQ